MKNKKLIIIPALLILTAFISIFFRLQFYNNVKNLSDGYYMDAETGTPYLTEMDSYYHLRITREIAEYGHPGDTYRDGEYWDSMSYAPEGRSVSTYRPLMSYIAIGVHRIASLFGNITLEQVAYWLNMFMSSLVIIPVFLLTREMCGSLGGIVAAVLSTLNYGYFIHTIPGFFDTDGVIAWVSCLFFYFAIRLLNSIEREKRTSATRTSGTKSDTARPRDPVRHIRDTILQSPGDTANLACLAVSFWALYSSWYVYYLFAAILSAALIAFTFLKRKDNSASPALRLYPLFMAGGIILLILLAEPDIVGSIADLLKNMFVKNDDLFPNIFVSISELRTPSLWAGGIAGLFQMKVLSETNIGIINGVGGIVPFLCGLVMCVLFIRRVMKKEAELQHFLLIIWYAATLALAFRGWRFIMLLAMPVAILAGNFAGWVCSLMDRGKMMDRNVYKTILVLLMLFPTLYGVHISAGDSTPSGNTQLGQVMAAIREKTPEDTMLLSWWDYGYFFEEKSKRRTLFDGGSQSPIRSYWVAKAFASPDENLSANILRMLTGSGDKACKRMLEVFGENKETLLLMDNILSAGKEKADTILAQAEADEVTRHELLNLLFPENLPRTECILPPEMSGISRWFAHFGMRTGKYLFDESDYAVAIDKMTTVPPVEGENVYSVGQGFNLIINKAGASYEAHTSLSAAGSPQPVRIDRVIVINPDGYMEFPTSGAAPGASAVKYGAGLQSDASKNPVHDPGWTVILENQGNRACVSLVTKRMAASTFGRMFYCRGAGLSCFTPEPELSDSVLVYRLSEDAPAS